MKIWRHLGLPALAAAAVTGVVWMGSRFRRDPHWREARRRRAVHLKGRLAGATITDVQDDSLYYTYSVYGATYTAAQDVSQLKEHLPAGLDRLIGPATLKYAPDNPANSIVICEQWSGIRAPAHAANGE